MMANKNKENAYPHKILRWFFSLEVKILLVFLVIGILVIAVLIPLRNSEKEDLEFARVLILAMGALGGAYGLILATIRSVKFSDQVKTGQEQLFNEQLGRGAELLANGEIVMRQTGIRVLEDLAETTINQGLSKENIKQAQLIMRIIHDFVHADTNTPLKGNEDPGARIEKGKENLDIALGIKTLASLYNESGRLVELEELVQFRNCRLEGVNFTDANLQGADFWGARLQGALFYNAKLEWADCSMVNFLDAQGLTRNHVKGMIFLTGHRPILPKKLKQFLNEDRCYEAVEDPNDESSFRRRFIKSDAEWSGRWANEYIISIHDSEGDG